MIALALLLAASPQAPDVAFPPSTALAERVDPAALQSLSELVGSFVEADEVVGAELLVIVNDRTVLHQAYGWRDRERELPMQTGSVFCVRSMTKPLIGASIWMLVEERKLGLDDPVAKFLPAFDVEGKRGITIRQLLTHTSGLPMSLIAGGDPRQLASLRAVADLGAAAELESAPGTAFHYSDQGTDTLAAVIEVASGKPAATFVRERLLEPLGMGDSTCTMAAGAAGDPLREKTVSAYAGEPRHWTRFWSPEDAPLFGTFLGSQGLYASAVDYARFLDLYLHRGRANDRRLLSASSVRGTLERGPFELGAQTGVQGVHAEYGSLMQLWTRPGEDGQPERVAFGHSGSDGTWAWAFPERHALVMYFTQSRGNLTGIAQTGSRVEERLGQLFLGLAYDPLQAAPPLEEYLGYFWEGEGDIYRAIVRDGRDLALEIVGRAVVPLDFIGEDRWKLRPEPSTVLAFDRDDAGRVSGFHIGDHAEFRLTPRADLPSADEVAARVAAAHRLDKLRDAGVVRMQGALEIPKLKRSGQSVLWMRWPDCWRVDDSMGKETSSLAFDGSSLRLRGPDGSTAPLAGEQAELLRLRDPFLRFGDWRHDGRARTVIQELTRGEQRILLVRSGDCSASAPTLYVDVESGRLLRVDGMTYLEGMGRVGQKASFSDWRDVGGAQLPGRIDVELAHPMIGTIHQSIEAIELGVDAPSGLFELPD